MLPKTFINFLPSKNSSRLFYLPKALRHSKIEITNFIPLQQVEQYQTTFPINLFVYNLYSDNIIFEQSTEYNSNSEPKFVFVI
jgi:hypothetical protein